MLIPFRAAFFALGKLANLAYLPAVTVILRMGNL
jgi:hypothetical protein